MALWVERWHRDLPLIAEIVEVKDKDVLIKWLVGTYSSVWCIATRRQGRHMVPWLEEVPISSVLFEVTLTRSNRQNSKTKSRLKDRYSQLLSCCTFSE